MRAVTDCAQTSSLTTRIEKMIVFAFGKKNILLHVMQNSLQIMLGKACKAVEWSLCTGDVHALRDAPIKTRALRALFRHERFHGLPVARLE